LAPPFFFAPLRFFAAPADFALVFLAPFGEPPPGFADAFPGAAAFREPDEERARAPPLER
jgi:hypothetical protein